ncbi:hypothetical protein [Salinispira pacifica]
MADQGVLVFDICSSTVIMEELVKSNQLEEYSRFMALFSRFLEDRGGAGRLSVYKFLGDGFILLFDSSAGVDRAVLFANELYRFSAEVIPQFLSECIDIEQLPRTGITMGMDVGPLHRFVLREGQVEFAGRPLNFAARLQGSLSEKEHANRLLLSLRTRKEIRSERLRTRLVERQRVFRNLSGGSRLRCFELSPADLDSSDIEIIRREAGVD